MKIRTPSIIPVEVTCLHLVMVNQRFSLVVSVTRVLVVQEILGIEMLALVMTSIERQKRVSEI